jgi:signal transduction histidine kinase
MTTTRAEQAADAARATAPGAREAGRTGAPASSDHQLHPLPDVNRALGWMVAGFNCLFALTASTEFLDFFRSTSGLGAIAVVALVAVPLLVDAIAAARGRASRRVWALSAACYPVATLVWALSITTDLQSARPSWLVAMVLPAILQATMATRSLRATAAVAGGLAGCLVLVLWAAGGVPPAAGLAEVSLVAPFAVLLSVVVAIVRRAARRTGLAQQRTLRELAAARFDDATETERVRTDALVHDTILTTLLQAASAEQAEETDRARRMAANALRVIAHVNRAGELGAGVRLRDAVSTHEQRLDPAIRSFDVVLDRNELEDLLLPAEAADALLGAVAEAMDNSVRHADAGRRSVHLRPLGPDGVRIEIEDDGRGFSYPAATGTGISTRIVVPMSTVEGRAEVETTVGRGTTIRLSWGSVSVTDVRSIEARLTGMSG